MFEIVLTKRYMYNSFQTCLENVWMCCKSWNASLSVIKLSFHSNIKENAQESKWEVLKFNWIQQMHLIRLVLSPSILQIEKKLCASSFSLRPLFSAWFRTFLMTFDLKYLRKVILFHIFDFYCRQISFVYLFYLSSLIELRTRKQKTVDKKSWKRL